MDLKLSRRFVEQVLKRCAPFGLRVHSDSKKMDQYQKKTETDGRNTGAKKFVVPLPVMVFPQIRSVASRKEPV